MANANAVKIRSTKKKANGKPKYPKPSGANLAHNSAVNKATYWLNDGNKIIQSQSYNNTHEVNADWIKWENEARERYKNNPNNQRAIKSNAVLLEEGLIIIGTDVNAKDKDIEKIAKDFVSKFEKDNNTKVRHWAYHNHEGHEEDGKEHINRHIHFIFDNVDNNGVMVRRNWKRDYFKQMQTDIFDISKKYIKNIERAKESEYEEVEIEDRIVKVNTRKQIHHRVFRQMKGNEQIENLNLKFTDMMKERDETKKENSSLKGQNTKLKNANETLKFDKKELEEQLKKLNSELRETLKELGALRPQYAQLEQLNKELKEDLKNKVLNHEKVVKSYQDLEKNLREELTKKDSEILALKDENKVQNLQILQLEKENEHQKSLIEVKEIDIIDLKNQNKSLEEQKTVLEYKVTDLTEKINSRANMTAPQPPNDIRKEFELIKKEEFEEKDIKTGLFATEKAKVLKSETNFLQRTWNLISKKYEDLKEKYNDLVSKYNTVANENKTLKAELEELKQERSSFKQQKEKSKDQLEVIVEQFEVNQGEESESSLILNEKEVETEEKTKRKKRTNK